MYPLLGLLLGTYNYQQQKHHTMTNNYCTICTTTFPFINNESRFCPVCSYALISESQPNIPRNANIRVCEPTRTDQAIKSRCIICTSEYRHQAKDIIYKFCTRCGFELVNVDIDDDAAYKGKNINLVISSESTSKDKRAPIVINYLIKLFSPICSSFRVFYVDIGCRGELNNLGNIEKKFLEEINSVTICVDFFVLGENPAYIMHIKNAVKNQVHNLHKFLIIVRDFDAPQPCKKAIHNALFSTKDNVEEYYILN